MRCPLQQLVCAAHGTRAPSRLQGKRQRQRVDYSLGGGDDGDDEDFSASSGCDSSGGSDQEALTMVCTLQVPCCVVNQHMTPTADFSARMMPAVKQQHLTTV